MSRSASGRAKIEGRCSLCEFPEDTLGFGLERAVREGLANQRRPPYIQADPQGVKAALLRTPSPPAGDKGTRKVKRKAAKKR